MAAQRNLADARFAAEAEPQAYAAFVARFLADSMPFCPIGLRFLYALHQAHPDLYEQARQYGFAYFDDPAFLASADARAIKQHVARCENCQAC